MSLVEDLTVNNIDGVEKSLVGYSGQVLLIVNVASKCGFTPQYESLEKLYQDKRGKGFEVLAFPANNFMGQEPGADAEIKSFCTLTYNVSFSLFSKISVSGPDQHPLYSRLIKSAPVAIGDGPFRELLKGHGIETKPSNDVLWNFEKFLISRKGEVVARFAPDITADDPLLIKAIDEELAKA